MMMAWKRSLPSSSPFVKSALILPSLAGGGRELTGAGLTFKPYRVLSYVGLTSKITVSCLRVSYRGSDHSNHVESPRLRYIKMAIFLRLLRKRKEGEKKGSEALFFFVSSFAYQLCFRVEKENVFSGKVVDTSSKSFMLSTAVCYAKKCL